MGYQYLGKQLPAHSVDMVEVHECKALMLSGRNEYDDHVLSLKDNDTNTHEIRKSITKRA